MTDQLPDIATDDMLTVCADGRTREIANTMHRNGEPLRVRCTDGTEWDAANCEKPQAQTPQPVEEVPVRTPLEEAATLVQQMMCESHRDTLIPSEEFLRLALEPYFQKARRDALNEALRAMDSRAGLLERAHYRPNYASLAGVVRRLRDAT